MREVDAVVIGSGHNGLVAAAYLARAGWSVEVLERNAELGGAVATEELTLPGFRHDTFSSWHPLFLASATYRELGDELAARGLAYVNTELPGATVRDGGEPVLLHRDPRATEAGFGAVDARAHRAELERFLGIADLVGALTETELHSRHAVRLAARLVRRLGRAGTSQMAQDLVASARAWLHARFAGDAPAILYAPWILHTGLSPDDAGGALQLLGLVTGLHMGGAPLVRGGADGFTHAFRRLIEDHGGTVRTGADVTGIVVSRGAATGVVVSGQERVAARRAVVANVTPSQLYGRLLPAEAVPAEVRRQASRYRYGRAGMQIHVALSEPLSWRDRQLAQAAIVHVADSLDDVRLACVQASAGLLPARPTVACGQPTALDPSRAPDGRAILWIQLQEVPRRVRGDAAGELGAGSGEWTAELAEAYADRVLDRVAEHVTNLTAAVLARRVLSPADLERRNPNLVGGDPYGGSTTLDQGHLWRPLRSAGSHATPVPRLFQCGASTHPGPGLNAASGRIVARSLLAGDARRRPGIGRRRR